MRPEILAEIQRRTAEQRRRIKAGELKVCSKSNPMPAGQGGKAWFHEEAKCEQVVDRTTRVYRCPVCWALIPVKVKKFEVQS